MACKAPPQTCLQGQHPSRSWLSPSKTPSGTGPIPALPPPLPPLQQTHSRVSRVMMRMGLEFMPPTQLLLHMKLYRMVVNSVPTCTQEARRLWCQQVASTHRRGGSWASKHPSLTSPVGKRLLLPSGPLPSIHPSIIHLSIYFHPPILPSIHQLSIYPPPSVHHLCTQACIHPHPSIPHAPSVPASTCLTTTHPFTHYTGATCCAGCGNQESHGGCPHRLPHPDWAGGCPGSWV